MRENLKARLKRIRDTGKSADKPKTDTSKINDFSTYDRVPGENNSIQFAENGWQEAGYNFVKRELSIELSTHISDNFPQSLAILIPDIFRIGRIPFPKELLFFDLETTGLSGGAGTLAFLAAFGRFSLPGRNGLACIKITQYLLLDYSGEGEFIEKVVSEFSQSNAISDSSSKASLPIVVSYNGKCFDSQILKNRCLMNGITPPEFFHADLLHPARRLWKKILPDCSQASVEVLILGLDRTGDVSGALAPEIWFSFLKTGDPRDLFSVCDHNMKDVTGLATLFLAFAEIAKNPMDCRFRLDEEALALSWHNFLKKRKSFFESANSCHKYENIGELLLKSAVKNNSPRAAIVLAINAEWRLKDYSLALSYTESALASADISDNLKEELENRKSRLINKI